LFYTDDDTDDLMLFEMSANKIGAEAHLFDNGDAMLDMMRNPPPMPTIVFVDLNMPKKSGYEVIEEIRNELEMKTLPVVVLSTAADNSSVEKCRNAGASYYIQKPTSMDKLRSAIAHTLEIDWTNPETYKNFFHKH